MKTILGFAECWSAACIPASGASSRQAKGKIKYFMREEYLCKIPGKKKPSAFQR